MQVRDKTRQECEEEKMLLRKQVETLANLSKALEV